MKKLFLLIALAFILGCTQAKDFNYGLKQINSLNLKYNTTVETYPKTIEKINLMTDDYNGLKVLQLESGQEAFNYVIDYRLLNLEAEKLFIQSQKYGNSGTTKYGFGCKIRPLIIESAGLRNKSALKAFEAVSLLREFVGKYPEESKSAGLTAKNALFLNATFYEISTDARRDTSIINNFCPQNETLNLYREEFRKRTNLTEGEIGNLSYEDAVSVWKIVRSIG
ncbi:hypothetical protein HYX07_04280 [Candidatus Woesearchaeota archaeon]|nr:hypothetical protein [Candidatus Woesearchaeota archaeon]